MAKMNLERLSIKELGELKAEIDVEISERRVKERETVKAKLAEMAANSGFSVAELFGGKRGGGRTGKVAPKYRNPENPVETWTGRGRQPRWLVAAMKKGAKLDRFLIR
jgi:DNA-binding protein H-NS